MDDRTRAELLEAMRGLVRAQRDLGTAVRQGVDVPHAGVTIVRMLARQGAVPLAEVATALGVDLSVASRQVAALVDDGLAERTVDPEDRRARLVALTPAGERVHARIEGELRRRTDVAFADWSARDVADLVRTVERLAGALATAAAHPDEERPAAGDAPPADALVAV
ncbi:MarR family winged helix-turn-helix transcriptional regulator [Cellulomonas endophytica]|uniref:MarR family winged helix-turn-helix transcriptional regulator n=1 Tax=Cellulomonas endophytica TaxID=2494735 RepID=UPI001013307D|nr:MarR family transcriptional regulator [Cellulomonas endophytica]